MDYVKLTEAGGISYAPKNKDGYLNFNKDVDLMAEYGYKPLIQAEREDGKSYSISYKETKKGIQEVLTEIESDTQSEADRINNLTMTALDFIKVLQGFGLSLEQINAYLESNLDAKMQLTYCNNVYCGVAKSLMPVTVGDITITADMVEKAFKEKAGIED